MLLAQSASLDAAMSEGLGIIAKFLFIVAVIVIAHGGWQIRGRNAHNPDRPVSKPVVPTHAGDDCDGEIWGFEGINILLILAGLILSVGLSMMLFRQAAGSFTIR